MKNAGEKSGKANIKLISEKVQDKMSVYAGAQETARIQVSSRIRSAVRHYPSGRRES